jgi:uncharacterized protein (TIGR02217 family)
MAFLETPRLNPRITFGARGGPRWSTTKAHVPGGARVVNRNFTYPLHTYDISQCIRTNADFEIVRAFFYNVYGAFDGFRFKDWSDFSVTAATGGTSLVSGSIYQLERLYTTGARTFRRQIKKPISPIIFYRNGVAISPTIDYTNGQVTVTGHTGGDVYTWAGEFDVPVAFVNDQMEAEIVDRSPASGRELLLSWPTIQVEEIRL